MEAVSQFFTDLLNFILRLFLTMAILTAIGWIAKIFLANFFFRQNLQKKLAQKQNYSLLAIKIPKNNDHKENSAEAMFSGLHSLFKTKVFLPSFTQTEKDFSFEILAAGTTIHFCVFVPKNIAKMVSGQIYAQYPEAEIGEVRDYTELNRESLQFAGAELKIKSNLKNPIKTYGSFEINPLLSLAGSFSGLSDTQEQVWIQILTRPASFTWLAKNLITLKYLILGRNPVPSGIGQAKESKPLFQTKIRVLAWAQNSEQAKSRLGAVLSTFKQFKNPKVQEFGERKITHNASFLDYYKTRSFDDFGFVLNSEELATLFHLPYTQSGVAGVVKTTSKKAEPPSNLPRQTQTAPEDISLFAETNFRGEKAKFGLKRADRRRHLYVVGKTGMGKSKLLELLMLEDVRAGKGFGLIDPHGDLSETILKHIPQERVNDIIYFNPADHDYPVAFNLLESSYQSEEKQQIVQGFIGIFKKLFTIDFNPRLEHMIRYIILALLDSPASTILGINRLLSDTNYRQKVIANIEDPVVKSFWATEFAAHNERYSNESIVPILNKMGQFLANPLIRNTVGQTQNAVDFRKIMDEGKILIINLSRGKLGEENSDLLGSMIITKIQQAAMSRANVEEEKRKDFFLYVDEFQNFATSAFANIFTEARKYRLNLTVAHQYLSQLPQEVKGTVFGNVGSILTFRVGAEDAAFLSAEFAPTFLPEDLISLDIRDIYLKISVDGQTSTAFSAHTLDCPPPPIYNEIQQIIANSRLKYAKPRISVENEITRWQSGEGMEMVGGKEFPEPIV